MGHGLTAIDSHVRPPFQCHQQPFLCDLGTLVAPKLQGSRCSDLLFALTACTYLQWHCHNLFLMLLHCCTGATALQTSVLTAELNRVLQLDTLELAKGRNCTITLDGWSNDSMESLYGFLVLFPDGRSILYKTEDYSEQTHSGRFLAGKQVQ